MPLKIVRGKNLPIGLDIGSSKVKAVQLRLLDGNYELIAANSREIPQTYRDDLPERLDFLADAIRGILKPKAFHGRQCVLSLPAEATFVQHIKIPRMNKEEIPVAIRTELRGKLPYDVDEAVVRYVVAGDLPSDSEAKQEIIVVCVSRSLINSYLAMSRRAKLDVIGINIESCAVVECFNRLFRRDADVHRTILYIDMGTDSTQVVFSHGSHIVFARNLKIGGIDFDQALAEGMQLPVDQAHSLRQDMLEDHGEQSTKTEIYRLMERPMNVLSNELNKCMRYHESIFHNRSIERAIFLGGQAYDKQLCQSLAQMLNLPAQIGDPLVRVKRVNTEGLKSGLDQRAPQPDWAVAVGLCIGATKAA